MLKATNPVVRERSTAAHEPNKVAAHLLKTVASADVRMEERLREDIALRQQQVCTTCNIKAEARATNNWYLVHYTEGAYRM
jgi:hypothetical protein